MQIQDSMIEARLASEIVLRVPVCKVLRTVDFSP